MSLTCNLVLIFAFIVGLAVAADLHCCMSKKIYGKGLIVTATLQNGSSNPTMTQNSFTADSDLDRRMQAVNGSVITMAATGTTIVGYQVIRDFNNMKTYNIVGNQCMVTPLTDLMLDGCVPKEMNLTGTYMFGSTQVNGWYGFVDGQYMTMTTTVNDCTFMSSTRMGTMPDGTSITETIELVDIVQNQNSYDGVFDIPQSCKTVAATVG